MINNYIVYVCVGEGVRMKIGGNSSSDPIEFKSCRYYS